MNKRDFLKTSGVLGIASILPGGRLLASNEGAAGACVLIPTETSGPFPLDLTENLTFFRQDIRETQAGAALWLRLRIIGASNCEPMPNLRVNVWHCDKDGVYSGYTNQNGGVNTTGLTFLRGYQITDANGEVEFLTIFPGWYPGRVCHVHFQVYVSSSYAAISQLTFPVAEKQALYVSLPTTYNAGPDPMTIEGDGIFADGYQYQLATLGPDGVGNYESFLEVTVQGSGVVGLQELQNKQQFEVGQNYPNPYQDSTAVPITLHRGGDLLIELFDLQGKRVANIIRNDLPPGEHRIPIDMVDLGLPQANYAYQVQLTNGDGLFRDCKLMTAAR